MNKTTTGLVPSTHSKTHPAFTIIELLIVIVVIAVLATISIIVFRGIQDRAETAVLESDLTQAAKQLAMDNAIEGTFPDSSTDPNTHLASSTGVTYEYDTDGSSFCLTATRGEKAYHITSTGSPQPGVCPGHTGPIVGGGGSPTCDTGYIPVPGNSLFGTSDFCVMKYEAKNNGSNVAVSQAIGTPWVSISQADAITVADNACSSCHLITEAEWLTIAHNIVNVGSNWTSGSVGSGSLYTGHVSNNPGSALAASSSDSDGLYGMTSTGSPPSTNNRRTMMLSNGEVIWDFSGNTSEWTDGQVSGAGNHPGGSGHVWREWNSVTGTGTLVPNPFPSFGTPAAASWTSSQGIGRLNSNSDETSARALLRGGFYSLDSRAGVFSLSTTPSAGGGAAVTRGFRVAQ